MTRMNRFQSGGTLMRGEMQNSDEDCRGCHIAVGTIKSAIASIMGPL